MIAPVTYGTIYMMVRPSDNMVVPVTCTSEQLKWWEGEGYTRAHAGAKMRDIIPKVEKSSGTNSKHSE